jgi:hypothetical protein
MSRESVKELPKKSSIPVPIRKCSVLLYAAVAVVNAHQHISTSSGTVCIPWRETVIISTAPDVDDTPVPSSPPVKRTS